MLDYDAGRGNLHALHVKNSILKSGAICMSCHYNQHSNVQTTTTQYNINGTTYTTPPPGTPTRLVNFSPNVLPVGSTRPRPEWWFDTVTKGRQCYLVCHTPTGATGGNRHSGSSYKPASGDLP